MRASAVVRTLEGWPPHSVCAGIRYSTSGLLVEPYVGTIG